MSGFLNKALAGKAMASGDCTRPPTLAAHGRRAERGSKVTGIPARVSDRCPRPPCLPFSLQSSSTPKRSF